jgi:hypothetical protein
MTTMTNPTQQSHAWIMFTYISFGLSLAMVGGGILFLPLDLWVKGYFAMGAALLIQSCFTLSKALRDAHESSRFVNRIEEARTEKLLREVA